MTNTENCNGITARRIGVTGGVGSGKSAVLSYIQEAYGALVLRTDDLAKELMEPGAACYEEVRALFGPEVLREDGSFDRPLIASKVFADPELLEKLNGITHPAVLRYTEQLIRDAEEKGTRIVCIESALFVDEDGNKKGNESYHELWYVCTDAAVRRERLKASRGYSDEKTSSIMANQVSDEVLRQCCDVVIDNSGDFSGTKEQIDRLLTENNDAAQDEATGQGKTGGSDKPEGM